MPVKERHQEELDIRKFRTTSKVASSEGCSPRKGKNIKCKDEERQNESNSLDHEEEENVKNANEIACSPCKVVIECLRADLVNTIKPVQKRKQFSYSFPDTSQNSSLSDSDHTFAASKFYKGNSYNPFKKRILSKRGEPIPSVPVNKQPVTKKVQKTSKVTRSRKKGTSKGKKLTTKPENVKSVPPQHEDLATDENENPVEGRKFFTARRSVQSKKQVFTTALAWKKGVQVVKSGSVVSVKSEPLSKKPVRHPRVRLPPVTKQPDRRKLLEAVENVPESSNEVKPETVLPSTEQKQSKCIIIRLTSPSSIQQREEAIKQPKEVELPNLLKSTELISPPKKVKSPNPPNREEPAVTSEELSADFNNDDDAVNGIIPTCELESPNNSTEDTSNAGDARLYPVFHRGIWKKQRQRKITYCSTPKFQAPFPVKQKHFIKEAKDDGDKEQMIIDAGQKEIGAKHCPTCNMIYSVGDAKDEKMHSRYHETYLANLKFPGWKKERVLKEYLDGRIIMITKEDKKYMLKKVEDIVRIVNRDLGFPDLGLPVNPDATFLLFISLDKRVVGCLIAERVTQATRIVFDASSQNVAPCLPGRESDVCGTINFQKGLWCSGSETVKVVCGINRIWTASNYRRQKIASRLVDSLKWNFIYGYPLSNDEIAFSDPSLDGREFAASYMETPFFLVYK